jgi:hypothetical protein
MILLNSYLKKSSYILTSAKLAMATLECNKLVMCISRLVEFELQLELKIEQKYGTSLVKLVLSRRRSASLLQSVCPSQLYWENIAHRYARNSPTTPSNRMDSLEEKNDPNSRLSMESNYRPQLGSFELKLLKKWVNFKHINAFLRKRHMIEYFWKNMSKIPGENGSSLNKQITLKINVLANITITKTSVLVVYP